MFARELRKNMPKERSDKKTYKILKDMLRERAKMGDESFEISDLIEIRREGVFGKYCGESITRKDINEQIKEWLREDGLKIREESALEGAFIRIIIEW